MKNRPLPEIPEGTFVRFLINLPARKIKAGECRHLPHDAATFFTDCEVAVVDDAMNDAYKMFGKMLADSHADHLINIKQITGGTIDEHRTRLEFRTSMAKSFGIAPDEFCDDLPDDNGYETSLRTKGY